MAARESAEVGKLETRNQLLSELRVDQLSRGCDPDTLPFHTTDELPGLQEVIGQPRAFRALELGIEVDGIGYNIFVLGVPDSGRTTLTLDYLKRKAAQSPKPEDWCYVNNFENPGQPRALRLPAGMAVELRKDMKTLVGGCADHIPQVFSSEEYTRERDRLVNAMNQKIKRELSQLEEHLLRYNFILLKTPYGLFLSPGLQGKPLTNEEFEKLSGEQKEKLAQLQEKLSGSVEKTLALLHEIEQTAQTELQDLDLRTSLFIIRPFINDLKAKYAGVLAVMNFLDLVQVDMVRNASQFRSQGKPEPGSIKEREWAVRYEINVLVNNAGCEGAPVIVENQPTYPNLLGSIDQDIILGGAYTDFSKIRAGALHRANGGSLILPARDVLINPYAWEGLKRVLRDGEIRMIELGSQMGLVRTTRLDPEPVPLFLKVIMVGTPMLYYMLRAYDEDFAKLFKIRAEFATEMERTSHSEQDYALFVKSVIDQNHLHPFDRTAVARIIETGSRMVQNQKKLSTQFGIIADLICESSYWAKRCSKEIVDHEAVQKALDERIYRSSLVEERIQELIADETIIVEVNGRRAGQINALSVSSLGDYMFGRPNRVTASVYAGKSGVVDIERQAKLGGPIHTKGVLIISGFLGDRFGQNRQLNLTASLTFEQSYDEVEGDSASAAELLALLSAIAGVAIDQSRAITGSVSQHGHIQAIGGVNEKIEGFFQTCKSKGLTGEHGVIIPYANQSNLMLKKEVLEAVEQGVFHIWAVKTIDEAIKLLTGHESGERQDDGSFPEGTFNQAVVARLEGFSRVVNHNSDQKGETGGGAGIAVRNNETIFHL
jgi:predicted ATP-dependent protease